MAWPPTHSRISTRSHRSRARWASSDHVRRRRTRPRSVRLGVYDRANSTFQTTVVTVLCGPYLTALAQAEVGDNGVVLRIGGFRAVTAKSLFRRSGGANGMTRAPRWVLACAASFFAYFALLVYCDVWRPQDAGFEADYHASRMVLTRIAPGSPAARAGLRPHDIVESADGKPIHGVSDWTVIDVHVAFDRPIALTVARGDHRVETSLTLPRAPWAYWTTGSGVFLLLTLSVQFLALALALVIVLKRPDDAMARTGAWALATVGVFKIVPPARLGAVWRELPVLASALLW